MTSLMFSYAHADGDLRHQLDTHLGQLKREGLQVWYDRDVAAGDEYEEVIMRQLELADIILLLVSRHFLDSDFCQREMQRAMERHNDGEEVLVIPVLLEFCDWRHAPFAILQVVPNPKKPVSEYPNCNEAFAEIVAEIRKVLATDRGAPGPRMSSRTASGTQHGSINGIPGSAAALSGVLHQGAHRTSPHDLEALWGVDRTRLAGLIGGVTTADPFARLQQAEAVLHELCGESGAQPLPTRHWVRLDVSYVMPVRKTVERIWALKTGSNRRRIDSFPGGSRSEESLGLYLKLPSKLADVTPFDVAELLSPWAELLGPGADVAVSAVLANCRRDFSSNEFLQAADDLRTRADCSIDALWLDTSASGPNPATLRGDDRIVSILRRQLAGDRDAVISNEQRELLSPEMSAVLEVVEKPSSEALFLRESGVGAFALALSAGLAFPHALELASETPLTAVDYWWLAVRLRPTRNRLAQVLRLDPARKAIWGLCSAQEWAGVPAHERTEVVAARQGRPILPGLST